MILAPKGPFGPVPHSPSALALWRQARTRRQNATYSLVEPTPEPSADTYIYERCDGCATPCANVVWRHRRESYRPTNPQLGWYCDPCWALIRAAAGTL